METKNPLFFIFDMMKQFLNFLDSFTIYGISFYSWIFSFLLVGIIVSVFWKGARG